MRGHSGQPTGRRAIARGLYMKSRSGRRKVMFGTNYPMILHDKALEDLDALALDAESRELYLDANARRVFDI